MEQLKNKMNLVTLAACLLMVINVFLPYASAELFGYKESVALIEGSDGKVFIVMAIVAAVFVFLNKKKVVLGVGSAALAFTIMEIVDFKDAVGQTFGSILKKEIGFYLMIVSSVVLFVSALIANKQDN